MSDDPIISPARCGTLTLARLRPESTAITSRATPLPGTRFSENVMRLGYAHGER